MISGRTTVCDAAERVGVSEQAVRNWRKQFIEGGTRNMRGEAVCGHLLREESLIGEISDLKAAIAELYLQLKANRTMRADLPALRQGRRPADELTFRRVNGMG